MLQKPTRQLQYVLSWDIFYWKHGVETNWCKLISINKLHNKITYISLFTQKNPYDEVPPFSIPSNILKKSSGGRSGGPRYVSRSCASRFSGNTWKKWLKMIPMNEIEWLWLWRFLIWALLHTAFPLNISKTSSSLKYVPKKNFQQQVFQDLVNLIDVVRVCSYDG